LGIFFIKWESIFSIQLGIYFLSEKYDGVGHEIPN
jgi:hypothetical protein